MRPMLLCIILAHGRSAYLPKLHSALASFISQLDASTKTLCMSSCVTLGASLYEDGPKFYLMGLR